MNDEELQDAELDALLSGGLFVVTVAFAVVGAIILMNLG
jgi:hypothetical protein